MEELSRDELWAIYKTLPESLKEAIFSEDTADAIWNICRLYDIKKTSKVARVVGDILSGLLPPEMLATALVARVEISQEKAKKASMEIEHFILNPLKKDLDKLYEKEGDEKEKAKDSETKENETEEEKEISPQAKKDNKKTRDIYREPIE